MIRPASISKSLPGRSAPVAALCDIDLHVPIGQIFGVIGSSGAGKSTLVRLINLLERRGSGDIFVEGERVARARPGCERCAASPKVPLCDEATSARDAQTTRAVLDLLQELSRDLGVTIAVITHEMDVIRHACDRVAVLDHGRIVKRGRSRRSFFTPARRGTAARARSGAGSRRRR